jgi:hypothetical protein
MKRTLSLKCEALTPLTTDELVLLRAGEQQPALTLAPKECVDYLTQDSVIFCSNGCLTGPASCYC